MPWTGKGGPCLTLVVEARHGGQVAGARQPARMISDTERPGARHGPIVMPLPQFKYRLVTVSPITSYRQAPSIG
jgi:hypothetical protein